MTAPDYEIPKEVVPPGSQTGVYYIPISNLPFNVSWQQIKDYVRQVCEVDHVEVFQKSTAGWVRVMGRDNFEAAFGHLNGKEFNGRAIIADGKNADSPTLVRDLLVCKPTGSNNRPSSGNTKHAISAPPESPSYATGDPACHPDSSMLSSPISTTSSSFSQRGDGYSLSLSPSGFMATSPETSYPHAVMSSYDQLPAGFSQPPSLSTYGFGPGPSSIPTPPSFMPYPAPPDGFNTATSYAVQPPYNEYYPPVTASLTNQMAGMSIGGSPTGGVIYTEQRGVQIRDISRRASADQIRKMVRERAGPEANLITSINIPADKEGNPRGLAFVHFQTADLARRMERHLHGVEFKGRKLQVRLMKDGEAIYGGRDGGGGSPSASSSSKPHRSSRHHHSHHHHQSRGDDSSSRRSERRDKDSSKPEKTSGSSARSSPPSSGSKTPLVVGGNLPTKPGAASAPSASSSSRDKGKERHGKKSSVVIADGSSGRGQGDTDMR